jgi:hypothetical protein
LTTFRYTRSIVTPAMVATLDHLKRAVVSGRIVVPETREQLAAFRPIPPAALH